MSVAGPKFQVQVEAHQAGLASIWLTWIRQLVRDSQEKETLELELAGVEVSEAKVLDCLGRVSDCGCVWTT